MNAPRQRPRRTRSDAEDLTARLGLVTDACDLLTDRLGENSTREASLDIARIQQRLDLGVDHTVVSLLGGTGSGKSSLFNAVSGLDFADVGVRRPTTSDPTACVWGEPADALLDWLGVAPDRRIQRESALDADAEAALRGLVLLDMPDHDSVVDLHRTKVDRVLPLADLLVWVVDPQKYADEALHSGYLRRLRGHEAAMVVVMNQIDTVPEDGRGPIMADLRELLTADGLDQLRMVATSARTDEGVPQLRDMLADVAARRSTAAERAGAEITDVVRKLRELVDGPAAIEMSERARPSSVAYQAVLAGVESHLDLAAAVGQIAIDQPPAPLRPMTREAAKDVRKIWLRELGKADRWREVVARELIGAPQLAKKIAAAAASIPAPPSRGRMARMLGRRGARKRADAYRDAVLVAVSSELDSGLVMPTQEVLADRLRARDLLHQALPEELPQPLESEPVHTAG